MEDRRYYGFWGSQPGTDKMDAPPVNESHRLPVIFDRGVRDDIALVVDDSDRNPGLKLRQKIINLFNKFSGRNPR